MTREGAVEVNAATGKKKRISKRIRDADFAKTEAPQPPEQAAQPLPGGATSPPLTDTPPLPHAPGAEREQNTAAAERVLEPVSYTHLKHWKIKVFRATDKQGIVLKTEYDAEAAFLTLYMGCLLYTSYVHHPA